MRSRQRVVGGRSRLAAVLALSVLSSLTACSMQPGKEAVADFSDWSTAHPLPGMTTETARGEDVLPGVGSGYFVISSDGTSTPEQALDHYCSYVSATPVFFELRYPVRSLAEDPAAAQITVTLPCDEPSTFSRPTLVEGMSGLVSADMTEQPRLQFSTARSAADGLRQALPELDAREVVASTDGLYVIADTAAEPEAVEAVASVVELGAEWPISYVALRSGNVNYPAVLNVQVTGLRRRVQEDVNRIARQAALPARYSVNVVADDD